MNTNHSSQTRVRGVVMAVAAVLLSTASLVTLAADTSQPAQPPGQDAAQFARGAAEWQQLCGSCHNLRSPSELTNAEWDVAMGQMRVRAGLTGQQERDITAFLKASNAKGVVSLAPLPSDEAVGSSTAPPPTGAKNSLAAGNDIYHQTCVACHGADGKGAVPGAPNFTDSKGALSQADAVLENAILNGKTTPGVPIAMPPKGGNSNLNQEGIKSVLAYIRHAFLKQSP